MHLPASIIRRRPRRSRRTALRLGAVGTVAALVLVACNVSVTGTTLTALDAQEEAWYSNGDEPYLAVIQFRVTPGVPGSTETRFLGNLQEIAQHVDDGDTVNIPASMAATSFPDVTKIGFSKILAGESPEILGAVTVAMESDGSPWSAINGIMNDVRNELDSQLRQQIEPLSFADIVTPGAAAARLDEAARNIQAAASPSFWRSVGIFFSSFGDPDDVIDFKVLFFVAVTNDLAPVVDAQLASLPDDIVGRTLRNESLQVDYSGDGATYRINWDVKIS